MKQKHNNWFMRIFSYPVVVKDLLMSFVHEDFVKDLEFATLKRLNPDFFPASEKSRHADVIYEITSHGKTAYIYLFIEFFNLQLIGSCHYGWPDICWNSITNCEEVVNRNY